MRAFFNGILGAPPWESATRGREAPNTGCKRVSRGRAPRAMIRDARARGHDHLLIQSTVAFAILVSDSTTLLHLGCI